MNKFLVVLAFMPLAAAAADWPYAGQNISNTRNQSDERRITPARVDRLDVKWVARLQGDISATPAVDSESVYVTDMAGWIYRIDRNSGDIIWRNPVARYTDVAGDLARTTPAIAGPYLILGTQAGRTLSKTGARVIALDKTSGEPVWQRIIETHPAAVITQSAVVHGNRVFAGVSSWEEYVAARVPGYKCCTFRGSVVSLDVESGALIWKTSTAPDAAGYAGNAVFGSTPAFDPGRGLLFVTTGNSYSVHKALLQCVGKARESGSVTEEQACLDREPVNHVDAIVALDFATGEIRWSKSVLPFDPYTMVCHEIRSMNPANCPDPKGPDHDFAQGPALLSINVDGRRRDVVGAGQKSGVYWMLDRATGEVIWHTQVGPGSALGGMEWGSATDGTRIYTAISNYASREWTLAGHGADAGKSIRHGFWSALDTATGDILWQTADPNIGAYDMGAVTVANGVVFAGSMAVGENAHTMFAIDAATGEILWQFASGGSVNAGAAVVDGTVYWGSGYGLWGGRSNDKLFAFEIRQ